MIEGRADEVGVELDSLKPLEPMKREGYIAVGIGAQVSGSPDQMMKLLHILDCDVDLVVTPKRQPTKRKQAG